MSVKGFNIQSLASLSAAASDKKYVDLTGSDPAEGTKVIGHHLNTTSGGTMNQQWKVDRVNAGVNLYTLQNVNPGTYANIKKEQSKTNVVGSRISLPFEMIPVDSGNNTGTGAYTIRLPNTTTVWTLGIDSPHPEIILREYEAGKRDQQWVLIPIEQTPI